MKELSKQLKPGDLVAFFYRGRSEQFEFLIPYIQEGLAQNQRCLYIADDIPVGLILKRLEEAGVDVTTAQRTGALEVLTKSETYLRNGKFDPEAMLADLCLGVEATLDKGFAALRGSGDMGWALQDDSMLNEMIEYQRRLYEIFPTQFLAVCQYDQNRFSADVQEKVSTLHDVIIQGGKIERKEIDNSVLARRASENVRFMLRAGIPVKKVLAHLATVAEAISGNGAVASILLLDENGLLRNAASPKLPADYLAAIDRLKPDPNLGTCAAAAATGNVVYTRDFFADEKWAELRHLPRALGFVGAWSMPIKDRAGKVVGTFGTYFREARLPSEKEKGAVALLAEAAAIVLGRA